MWNKLDSNRFSGLVSGACAAALLLAGCGDDGNTTTETSVGSTGAATTDNGTTTTGPVTTGPDTSSTSDASTGPASTGEPTTGPGTSTGPAPVCGDGNVDAGEECDDGNTDATDAAQRQLTRMVADNVDRLKRIVDEFSQFARLPRPVLAPLELSELAQQVMSLYAPHDGLTYVVELEPGLRVQGDRDQLTQVLVNLVKNAEEAMAAQGGGVVTIRTSAKGRDAVLEVADSGPGIPAEIKARLFEPYVTSKPQGTGLGLAIALRIAQEHEGALVAEDASPGARFKLTLPRVP